jgi:hypothetical protein
MTQQNIRKFALCFGLVAVTIAGPLAGLAHADNRDRGHYDRHAWREGWYHRPDVYYSAPPVVYPPYGYYAAPGASFSLSIPIR